MPLHAVKTETEALLSMEELRSALRQVGEERYHHRHPFHLLMHEGKLSRGQLQAWALNRYYYQNVIPIRTRHFSRAATDRNFGGHGASVSSTMTATSTPRTVVSNAGSNSRKQLGWTRSASSVSARCCPRLGTR